MIHVRFESNILMFYHCYCFWSLRYFERAVIDMTSVMDSADQKGNRRPFPSLKLLNSVGTGSVNHFFFSMAENIHQTYIHILIFQCILSLGRISQK